MILAAEPAVTVVLLLALLAFGIPAAMLFGLIYGIVKKKPAIAVASVAAPIALAILTLLGAMALPFYARSRQLTQAGSTARVEWAAVPAIPAVPGYPPAPPMSAAPAMPHINTDIAMSPSWVKLALVIGVFFLIAKCFANRDYTGARRGGKMKLVCAAFLFFVLANWISLRIFYSPSRPLQIDKRAQVAMQVHQRISVDPHAQQVANKVAQHAGGLNGQSIQEIWEELNKPRIELDEAEVGAEQKVSIAEASQLAGMAPAGDGKKQIGPVAEKSPESIARSLARLERMVDQVTSVADRVSDTGTLIGKALVALNESLESSRGARIQTVEAPSAAVSTVSSPELKTVKTPPAEAAAESSAAPELRIPAELVEDVEQNVNASRPEWTKAPPQRIGNTWREVVATEEYATTDECARAADVYLQLKTFEHLQQLLGMPHGEDSLPSLTFRSVDHSIFTTAGQPIFEQTGNSGVWTDDRILTLRRMDVDLDFIRREIVPESREYYETRERSFGPMKKLYTMLEFTPSVDQELLRRWDELRREGRFAAVGLGAGSVLGLIGLAFGLLRVDTWTKGYYTKRLFFGVPAAIIGLVGLLVLMLVGVFNA